MWERLAKEQEHLVDLGSDQTSLHNPFQGGYYPVSLSFQESRRMMADEPAKFKSLLIILHFNFQLTLTFDVCLPFIVEKKFTPVCVATLQPSTNSHIVECVFGIMETHSCWNRRVLGPIYGTNTKRGFDMHLTLRISWGTSSRSGLVHFDVAVIVSSML